MNETPEQARTRRRWISLAELVAVAGVIIAALTLYIGWSDRRADRLAEQSAKAGEASKSAKLDLDASVEDGGGALLVSGSHHEVQDLSVRFPAMLGVGAQTSGARPKIEASWIEAALLKATDGGPDAREGRLPILVTTRYLDGDTPRSATDTYDLIWKTGGRLLRGRSLTLEGLRLRQRGGSQATIDRLAARDLKR